MAAKATGLFTDFETLRALDLRVISPLVETWDEAVPIRIWVAARRTGEDACALAILLQERISACGSRACFQLFATDGASALDRASPTFFAGDALGAMAPETRQRWFEPVSGGWRLRHSLRSAMVFARHDLLTDPHLSRIDIAMSRELGRLTRHEQLHALGRLNDSLKLHGALVVDGAGAVAEPVGFAPIDAEAGLFRKIAEARRTWCAAVDLDRWRRARATADGGAGLSAADAAALQGHDDSLCELAASREELFALNRELYEVNERLKEVNRGRKAKIRKLETQRAMLAGGAVIALFLDHELRLQWFTPASAALFPISERDLGRALTDFVPLFDAPPFFAMLREAMASGLIQERELRAADGRWYAVAVRRYEADAASTRGLAVTFADISAQKQAEASLRENAERLRLALAVGELATWDWNMRTGVVAWSDEQFLTGCAPGEIAPSFEAWFERIHPDDRAVNEAVLWAACQNRHGFDHECRALHADGTYRWVSAQGSFFYDDQGPYRMIGVARDITAQKRAQQDMLELNAELEQRVRDEIKSREDAMARLAQAERLAALGELAGGVAHDFNNILQGIATSAEVMRRAAGGSHVVARACGLQVKATERGAAITRRLLAFARRSDLRAAPTELSPLLAELREMLEPTLGCDISFVLDVPEDFPQVLADRSQLETVLVNLANNSRDAMERGGVLTITARRDTLPQARGGLAVGDYVRIEVADTGAGMEEATLRRACEPFYTTKPVGKGTGLGLSMARGFAEQSGGALAVASEAGRGTQVRLWLPVAAAPGRETTDAPAVRGVRAQGARILLVDDDPMIAELLTAFLRERDLDVTMAAGGAAALAELQSAGRFDLLVSDMTMPDINGFDVAKAARCRDAGLPIVILTGYADDASALKLKRQFGANFAILSKPITGDDLLDAIVRLLEARPASEPRAVGAR